MRSSILVGLVFVVALPSPAIVRRHDREDSRYLAAASEYRAVVDLNLPGGAGTLIAPKWVVTAAHAAQLMKPNHRVRIAAEEYDVARLAIFPGGGEGKDDIALVELAREVEGIDPIALYGGNDEAAGDRVVTFVGRGHSGDGKSGPVVRDGKLRAATNKIDAVKKNWLVFGFEAPPAGTELEGISGPGDSGGPAFVTIDGTPQLIGVSSGQDSRATGREGVYGVTEYYVRVSSYRDWILETIGEAVPAVD